MNHMSKLFITCLVLIAVSVIGLPTMCQAESSNSETFTIGLFATVIIVLFVVGLTSDIDYFTQVPEAKDPENMTNAERLCLTYDAEPIVMPKTKPVSGKEREEAMRISKAVEDSIPGFRVSF